MMLRFYAVYVPGLYKNKNIDSQPTTKRLGLLQLKSLNDRFCITSNLSIPHNI